MTVYELKRLYYLNNPDGHYFDRETMRFFGDSMRNFGLRDVGKIKRLNFTSGEAEEIDAVLLYRRHPVNGGLHGDMDFFRKDTGQVV